MLFRMKRKVVNMNNKKYIMALDAGTSSSRAIVFDHDRRIEIGRAHV